MAATGKQRKHEPYTAAAELLKMLHVCQQDEITEA